MNQPLDAQQAPFPATSEPAAPPSVPGNRKPTRRGRMWLLGACALAPFLVVLLVVSTANKPNHTSSSSSPSTSTSPSTSPADQAAPSSTGSIGAAGTAAAGIAAGATAEGAPTPPGSTARGENAGIAPGDAAGVSAWKAAHSGLLGDLISDVANMGSDAGSGDWPSLQADCARLQSDLQVAQSVPAVPDPSADALWNQVLGDFYLGVGRCSSGIDDRDASAVSEATNDTSSGAAALFALTGPQVTPAGR